MRKNVNRTVNNLSTKKNDAKHSKINRKELLIQNTKFILAIIAIIIAIIALVFGESKMIITQNKGNVPLTFNILNYQIITEGEQGEEPVIDYACTLAQAIQKAPTGSTIKVLADTTESTVANIPADKTITLNMNGKTIELTNSLSNYGTLTLTGEGEITSEEADTIVNYGTYAQQDAVKVSNTGTVLSGYSALVNSGEMTITGGEVEATNYAIKQLEEATLVVTRNTANNDEDVVGPNITSNKSVAIYAEKGTVTIGTNETPTTVINEENPVIKGKMHGIEAKAAATLNCYDGSIISESGKGMAIEYPETINKPTGKEIEKSITIETIENVETEIETTKLITPEYAENDKTTGNVVAYYETLDKALNSADNGNTIIPINATINDASTNNPTITSGKLLTLDLSGKNVILNKNIINEGTFTIKDSTSTTQNTTGTGKLESENNCITNEGSGNLTVTGGTILSTKSRTIIGNHKNTIINISGGEIKGTAIIESNGSYNGDAVIATNGTFNMTGGKVRSESAFSVWITGNGTANVTGGIIEKDKNTSTGTDRWLGAACFQNSSTNKTTIAGTALIQNYNGSNSNVIYCEKSGIIEVGGNAIVQNLGSVIAGTNYSTGKIIVKDNAKITSAGGVVLRNNFNNGSSTSFGTIEIQGGEVSTNGTNAIENTCKYGVIKILGGKVTATGTTAIYNSGSGATVTVGTVGSTSTTTPVITGRIYGDTGVGLITVYSGKITATTSEAIYSKGNVTIGSKDNNTPLTSPTITGVTYGVQTSGTFNFYDGQITGPTNKSIYKNPDDTPIEAGYVVRIRNNGDSTETAYLDNNFSIILNPNGGTYNGTTSNSTVSATYNTEVNLGIPTRAGYTFKQWKTSDGIIYDKNILTGTEAPILNTSATNENTYWRSASDGGPRTIIDITNPPTEGITKGFSIVGNGTITDVAQDTVPVTSGKTYTVSVWAKGTGSVYLQVGSSSWEGKNTVINNVTTWTKYSWTFIAGQNGNVVNGYTNIYFGNHGTGTVELCGMKLEEETGFADLLWSKVPSTTTAPTLVAEWTANTYTIKYNGNGNTGGSTASSTHTYDTSKALTTNGFTKTGYSFAGWSTSASDKNLIYDNNEYSVDNPSSSSSSNDFKQYSLSGPFESGEVYQLDVDVKGSGTMYNFFYGATNYRRVASWTSSTSGNSGTNSDGYNTVPLTSSYEHYTVTFTLGSSGSSSVEKRVLFRAAPGCTASIKNIRFTKISASSTAYMDGQSVKNLATTGTVNMYAMWAVDTLNNQSATSAGTTQMSASSKALASTSVKNKLSLGTKSVNLLDNNGETSNVNDTTENNNNELENVESLEQIKTETENAEITGNKEMHVIINATENTYSTFAEAIESANSGDTLKLLQDINLTEEVTIDKGKNIILDLNGKTISSTSASTINNNGTLTIKGTGIIKNETENGNVIYNTGILNIENVIITTAKNGGKCIYNDSEAEIENAKVIISNYDSIAIYNASNSKTCRINKTEITVEAEEIENYELIKNTNEFKETLNNLKQSYGIYNDSSTEVIIEDATIKIKRLKGVGIFNKKDGTITLGKEDNNVSTATPIIYAISDNTTGIINNEKGKINFYDGRIITTSSIKNMITKVLFNHEIYEELNSNIINTTLRLIEIVQEENVESNVESKTESVEEKKKNEVLNKQDTQEEQPQVKEETTEKAEGNS